MTDSGPGTTRRWASRLSAGTVATIAAIASYSHMRHLALAHGQDPLIATLLPLSADGLTIVGAVAIGDGRRHTWSAWTAFVAGVAASIVANVLAARPDVISRAISAWPAVALLAVVEVLSRGATGVGRGTRAAGHADDVAEIVSAGVSAELSSVSASQQASAVTDVSRAVSADVSQDDPAQASLGDADDVRTRAIAAVLIGDQTHAEAAASAGVTVRTLCRWIDQALADADDRTRRARGTSRGGQRQGDDPVSGPPADGHDRINGSEVAELVAAQAGGEQ